MKAGILILPGDGIGPEVIDVAQAVLEQSVAGTAHSLRFSRALIGGAALAAGLDPLPDDTLAQARQADAILLGAVGDPRFDGRPPGQRPESALLQLRSALGLYANLRPARSWSGLEGVGPLKPEVLEGTDLLVVRELTGGLYYGEPRGIAEDGLSAVNTLRYSVDEITRVARQAFMLARTRQRRLVSVDKANVLEVSRLWRQTVSSIAPQFPDVRLTHEYVDAAAMKLALTPSAFDVILTENMFGDILSDEAGAICGSLGLLPSASIGDGPGMFEPVHGSAPTIAGQNMANPVGAILSAAMLLEHGLGLDDQAADIVLAVEQVIEAGARTADLALPGQPVTGTHEFGQLVIERLK